MSKEKPELHKTVLRMEIDKTIQPKQYEPIKVIVDIEEDFYWEKEKDRDKKMREYRDRILKDFLITFNEAVVAIGEKSRCIGRIVTSGNIPVIDKKKEGKDDEVKDKELENWNDDF